MQYFKPNWLFFRLVHSASTLSGGFGLYSKVFESLKKKAGFNILDISKMFKPTLKPFWKIILTWLPKEDKPRMVSRSEAENTLPSILVIRVIETRSEIFTLWRAHFFLEPRVLSPIFVWQHFAKRPFWKFNILRFLFIFGLGNCCWFGFE